MRVTFTAPLFAILLGGDVSHTRDLGQPRPQVPRRIHVDAMPAVELGRAVGSAEVFGHVAAATRVGQYIVVLDDRPGALLFFRFDGHLARRIQTTDQPQPGQFKQMTWMGRCAPDALFVLDASMKRITVLDTAGAYVRMFRPPAFAARWSCAEDGRMATLLLPGASTQRAGGRVQTEAPILLLNASGGETGVSRDISVGEGRFGGTVTTISMGKHALYVGRGDSAYVDVYDGNARPASAIRTGDLRRILMSKAEFEKIVRRQLGQTWPDSILKKVLATARPKFHPLYRDVKVAPDGTVWLTISAASDDSTVFRALSAKGSVLGDVRMPHVAQILEAGNDYLLTEYRSGDRAEHVALFRVTHK